MQPPTTVVLQRGAGIEPTETSFSSVTSVKIEEASAEDIQDVKKALATLAHQVFLKLPQQKSRALSGASLAAIVGMSFLGQSDSDQKLFLQKLALEKMPAERFLAALASIVKDLACSNDKAKVCPANALAVAEPVNRNYEEAFKSIFDGEIFSIARDGEAVINAWAASKTDDKIHKLLENGALANVSAVLLNALFFSAEWVTKFAEFQEKRFTCSDSSHISTVFVHHRDMPGSYFYDSMTQAFQLDYISPSGHKLSFVACRPTERIELSEYLQVCTPDHLRKVIKGMEKGTFTLSMPELNIESRIENLKDILMEIGLPISNLPHIDPRAQLSKIVQQVKLQVNKDGTQGGVVTAGFVSKGLGDVTFDRPYVYFILDGETPIFQGTVEDPGVLVSKAQRESQRPRDSTDHFDAAKARRFLLTDRDIKVLLRDLPKEFVETKPKIAQMTLSGIRFTIVNYSDAKVVFEDDGNNGFWLIINDRLRIGAFSADNCQILAFQDSKQTLTILQKDEGAPHASTPLSVNL